MKKNNVRWLYLALGWVCTGLGVVGAFLPVIPTTPFLLVAVWAFSRSSLRLRNWLYHHPHYGASIRDWFEHGEISVRVKIIAITAMSFSVPTFYILTGSQIASILYLLVMASTVVFIATRPSRRQIIASPEMKKGA